MFVSGIGLDPDSTKNEKTCLALSQLADWIYGIGGSDEVKFSRVNLTCFVYRKLSLQVEFRELCLPETMC